MIWDNGFMLMMRILIHAKCSLYFSQGPISWGIMSKILQHLSGYRLMNTIYSSYTVLLKCRWRKNKVTASLWRKQHEITPNLQIHGFFVLVFRTFRHVLVGRNCNPFDHWVADNHTYIYIFFCMLEGSNLDDYSSWTYCIKVLKSFFQFPWVTVFCLYTE